MNAEPLTRTKEDYKAIIDRISVTDSPVGIDAQLTHAIIIEYLVQICDRLDKLEAEITRGT